jgi:hypothetical protein
MNCPLCNVEMNAPDDSRMAWPCYSNYRYGSHSTIVAYNPEIHRHENLDPVSTCINGYAICRNCEKSIDRTPIKPTFRSAILPPLAANRPSREQKQRWWLRSMRIAFGKTFSLMEAQT